MLVYMYTCIAVIVHNIIIIMLGDYYICGNVVVIECENTLLVIRPILLK